VRKTGFSLTCKSLKIFGFIKIGFKMILEKKFDIFSNSNQILIIEAKK